MAAWRSIALCLSSKRGLARFEVDGRVKLGEAIDEIRDIIDLEIHESSLNIYGAS